MKNQIVIERLVDIYKYINSNDRILLISGKKSFVSSGSNKILKPIIGNKTNYFSDFSLNPKLTDIVKGIKKYKENNCNTIIAVGGGSAIDVAKSIYILSSQKSNSIKKLVINNSANSSIIGKFIAVPTTAGTGSESTYFAVVYVDGIKYSLSHPDAIADVVVLDPSLTLTLPAYITATTGMDAIAQAIEAFWSVRSTKQSKQYSKNALKLLLPAIVPAVNDGGLLSRKAMLNGANLAGKAINIAKTTACHSVSYPITSKYNVPHGHAVSLTLPSFVDFNSQISSSDCQDQRGVNFVKETMQELFRIFNVKNATSARKKIEDIIYKIGLESNLKKLGIGEKDLSYIIKNGFNPQRIINNPRFITKNQLEEILRLIL